MAYAVPKDNHFCRYCGWVDLVYDENAPTVHEVTAKHICNKILYEYKTYKSDFSKNRDGICIHVSAEAIESKIKHEKTSHSKIIIHVKPQETAKFYIHITNDMKNEDVLILGIQLAHPQPCFIMNKHLYVFGEEPRFLQKKSSIPDEISVTFKAPDIGQYEMPVMITFHKRSTNRDLIIIRELKVNMNNNKEAEPEFYKCVIGKNDNDAFKIPKSYKQIFANNLTVDAKVTKEYKELLEDVKDILSTGPTRENYIRYFHTLLWYEETILRINLKKYNQTGVQLVRVPGSYILSVPGLAEKRPSLMIGDYVLIIPQKSPGNVFEGVINDMSDINVTIQGVHKAFGQHYEMNEKFDIRFILSRTSFERMHQAVHNVKENKQESKTFPSQSKKIKTVRPITAFFNKLIAGNREQRIAVEQIVSNSNGRAPYLLHGPPGTGKTVTIVEAILQLVRESKNNRILVCTDSNMAADHVAAALIKYRAQFTQEKFLLRANSKVRAWETLPECIVPYSNGTCREDFEDVDIKEFMSYNIAVTTLSHSATFAARLRRQNGRRYITHLFIDEAAQGSEPVCLIPICGLLSMKGSLILAGDPLQLGPVIISHSARKLGLGMSLMERLQKSFPIYNPENGDLNYTVMLRDNYRSNPDILVIPNALFYDRQLNAKAVFDPISNTDILNEGLPSRAITFHGLLSEEQKTKASPSFFNNMELELVQLYVSMLVQHHGVRLEDIGVVTPYIRQASKVKAWLLEQGYDKVEVGTVEAFQGKEKRVIIISTVRANSNMHNHDARYQLGFLVDDKRFNVAITRAKAKVIIIGNPVCLMKDIKWRQYIHLCQEIGTYSGCPFNEYES